MTEITHCDVFMAHLPHSDVDKIVECITGYEEVVSYLIGLETADTVGEHYHFIIESKGKGWYHKFSKRVFKDWYKLNGKAYSVDGVRYPRQYGKVHKVKDMEKMICYTVKDKNVRTDMSQQVLAKYLEKSYKKQSDVCYYTQILEKLDKFEQEQIKINYAQNKELIKERNRTGIPNPDIATYGNGLIHDNEIHIKIYIIKLLKEIPNNCITRNKVDHIWNRWISSRWTPEDIYSNLYRKR
jgi:hypothetical protein